MWFVMIILFRVRRNEMLVFLFLVLNDMIVSLYTVGLLPVVAATYTCGDSLKIINVYAKSR